MIILVVIDSYQVPRVAEAVSCFFTPIYLTLNNFSPVTSRRWGIVMSCEAWPYALISCSPVNKNKV